MNTVNTNEFFTINCSGESFEIKPGPPDHVKNLVNNVSQSPTDEELDTFLGYFFQGPLPSRYGSKFAKMRLCSKLNIYYEMGIKFGKFEKPCGELECVLFDYKAPG